MMLAPTNQRGEPKKSTITPLRSYVRHTRPASQIILDQIGRRGNNNASRPTAPTNVIGFDPLRPMPASRRSNRHGREGFFPPLKKRGSVKSARSTLSTDSSPLGPYYQGNLELVPNPDLTDRYYHGHRSAPLISSKGLFRSSTCPRNPDSEQKYPNIMSDGYREFIGGDLSYLPRARGFLSRRSVPFIDRQKIRRSATLLSQVICNDDSETFNPDLRQSIAMIKAGAQ